MRMGMLLVVRPYVHQIYLVTNIQAHARQYKFHHLTYLKEARFARQLIINLTNAMADIPSVMPITLTNIVVNSSCLATNHKVINQL